MGSLETDDPAFTVVIPTYNRSRSALRAVKSLIDTGFERIEIIVVDDGSTDSTPDDFREIHNPRLRFVRQENAERGAARNHGARLARGAYVGFMDSDDFALPNFFLEAQRGIAALGMPEVIGFGCRALDSTGKIIRTYASYPDPANDCILRGNLFGGGGFFIRKDALAAVRYSEIRELSGSEDWLFVLLLCARYSFRYWDSITWAYVIHGGNSVLVADEQSLIQRSEHLISALYADSAFLEKYGDRISEIRAFRHAYTALHLALAGGVIRPLAHIAKAAAIDLRGVARPATLGALKHIALNCLAPKRAM